jgi:hypothetical protein
MQPLDHYRQPFLDAERIVADTAAGRLELRKGERTLIMDVQAGDFDAAWQTLEALRAPASPCWAALRRQADAGLLKLADWLDRLGWIGEADLAGRARVAEEQNALRGLMRDSNAWLMEAADCTTLAGEELFTRHHYRDALLAIANAAGGDAGAPLADGPDLAGEALRLMLKRWRSTAAVAREVVHRVFMDAWRRLGSPPVRSEPDTNGLVLTLADSLEIGKQLWSVLALFVLSVADRCRSDYADFVPNGTLAGPGLNILIAAEAAAERLMAARGDSPLLGVLRGGTHAHTHRAAVGVYLHQYFITIRYIDAVYGFLQHRLREELRQEGTRYLLEEVGHEVHELEACHDLGVTDQAIAGFAPLPFFAAYPDALAAIAEADPLAFTLAISVAEGLPGGGKPIVKALTERGIAGPNLAAHQGIDEQLDHALVTRKLMQHIPWVEPEIAHLAIRRFLFIADLSQMGWRQLASYAGTPALPLVPVTLGMSPQQVLKVFSSVA